MTEDEAREWLQGHFARPAVAQLERFHSLLLAASRDQNLIAPSTLDVVWSRHIVDSAQLLRFAPSDIAHWVDIGSGAGLPGLVIAILADCPMILIEPRRLRADFLEHCIAKLGLESRVQVAAVKAQNMKSEVPAGVISARAVSATVRLLEATAHLADTATVFILPKGVSAQSEMAAARRSWHGGFHVEQSIVDQQSGIIVASGIARR